MPKGRGGREKGGGGGRGAIKISCSGGGLKWETHRQFNLRRRLKGGAGRCEVVG